MILAIACIRLTLAAEPQPAVEQGLHLWTVNPEHRFVVQAGDRPEATCNVSNYLQCSLRLEPGPARLKIDGHRHLVEVGPGLEYARLDYDGYGMAQAAGVTFVAGSLVLVTSLIYGYFALNPIVPSGPPNQSALWQPVALMSGLVMLGALPALLWDLSRPHARIELGAQP